MKAPSAAVGLMRSAAAHVAFAFLAMGAWAVFANRAHGLQAQLVAGLVQGAMSGAITLALKRSLEAMTARFPGVWATVGPPLVTCAVVLAVLVGVHRLVGTPRVWATIAVPYAVSSTYAWIYSFALTRAVWRDA